MKFVKWMDDNPLWLKVVLALPMVDVLWVVHRLIKSIEAKKTLEIVLAAALIVFGFPALWIVDIVTLLLKKKVLWFR
ncbi:MAG: hypothetical protein WCZ24_02950 [Bacilli bacterium]|jgi:hypothetical protein